MDEKQLYENFNTDDILVRSVIAGLLNMLNNKIDYQQTWADDTIETVTVPWWYSFGTSDERFMQDNYTMFGKQCFNSNIISGNFPPKPAGWISYQGSKIESSAITNRFIQGTYMKNVNGKLIAYTSFLYSMPLTIDFECKVECDNNISALKIEQAIREYFYKNKSFYVLFRGMRIGCCAGFPENYSQERTVEYSFDNAAKAPVLTFNISVETYQPVFDKTTEIERDKFIKGFAFDIHVPYESVDNEPLRNIKMKDVDTSVIYPSGTPIMIEWNWTAKDAEMLPIRISYTDKDCPCEEHVIAEVTDNQCMYIWDIPSDFTGFVQPEIIYPKGADIIRKPVIKIVPDENGRILDTSFIVIDRGYIGYESETLPFKMTYEDSEGNTIIVNGYKLRLDNGRVDANDPIEVDDTKIHTYQGELNSKQIKLKIAYCHDPSVSSEMDNYLTIR